MALRTEILLSDKVKIKLMLLLLRDKFVSIIKI